MRSITEILKDTDKEKEKTILKDNKVLVSYILNSNITDVMRYKIDSINKNQILRGGPFNRYERSQILSISKWILSRDKGELLTPDVNIKEYTKKINIMLHDKRSRGKKYNLLLQIRRLIGKNKTISLRQVEVIDTFYRDIILSKA